MKIKPAPMSSGIGFKDLFAPLSIERFLTSYFEQQMLIVNRNDASFYGELVSFMISGPVVVSCARGLAGLANWLT